MQALQWPHAGRCNCPSIVGGGTGCSGQASRRRARPSHSRVPGQPGSSGRAGRAAGCAGRRRTRKSSASRAHSHPCRGFPRGARAALRRWRLITPLPCWLLAISSRRRADRIAPRAGLCREGVLAPFTPQPAPGRLFLHGLFSFRFEAILHGGKSWTGAPTPHFLAIKQQSGG